MRLPKLLSHQPRPFRSGLILQPLNFVLGVSKSTAARADGSSSEEEATVLLIESDSGFTEVQKRQPDISVALKKTKKAKKQIGKQPGATRTKPQQTTKRRKKKL